MKFLVKKVLLCVVFHVLLFICCCFFTNNAGCPLLHCCLFIFSVDAFAVPNFESKENMFDKYASSMNLYQNGNVHQHLHKTTFGTYAFNGIDLTPTPGPRRPFNFFGVARQVFLNDCLCNNLFFFNCKMSLILTVEKMMQILFSLGIYCQMFL